MERRGKAEKKIKTGRLLFWKDCIMAVAILQITRVVCWNLREREHGEAQIALLFVLAVLLIARFSGQFLISFLASILAMLEIDYYFMVPYRQLDFGLSGYPFTFFVLFVVSNMVSLLMLQLRRQERTHLENEKEKMRANLLRAVSHDVRTPLTSIIGSISTVMDNYRQLEETEAKELMINAREEAQWMMRVTENLLAVTRVDESGMELKKTPELVCEVISSAMVKIRKRFPDAPITVVISDELLFVPMDPVLMEQVICNLVENAVLHGGRVSRILLSYRQEGDYVEFWVEDDGIGISAELLRAMRKKGIYYKRGEEIRDRCGMGIGLQVCKSIVEAHGGQFFLEAGEQGGTRALFWLPLTEREKEIRPWLGRKKKRGEEKRR